jgi:peptide/nickel transport system substrate-binding protein
VIRTNRLFRRSGAAALAVLLVAGCREPQSGPIRISAIEPQIRLVNANRDAVGPGSAMLLETVAQGLVRFDSSGEIEPALAQSWIVSDDGRRYTFRLRRTLWARGDQVTARQVVERLQAALARNSRNALKPVLGAVEQIEAMTEQVLEIRLKAPRPNFLQLLAQPELAMLRGDEGTGPYRLGEAADGALRLIPPTPEEDEDMSDQAAEILLRADEAAVAIARFSQGDADLVTGGTLGEIPLLAAATLPADRLVYDPARGLFGLAFVRAEGRFADPRFRHALAMAVDRDAIRARFEGAPLQPRASLLPPGHSELPSPAVPDWATVPLAERQEIAARIVAGTEADNADRRDEQRPRLRVAMPANPGLRILFAHLRRDWRVIGLDAVAVAPGAEADLRIVDAVAPADLVPWYLRQFLCDVSAVCDPAADEMLENARTTQNPAERQALLQQAHRALVASGAFIALGQPVRWSLRDERLSGFRPNVFARHSPTELIAREN